MHTLIILERLKGEGLETLKTGQLGLEQGRGVHKDRDTCRARETQGCRVSYKDRGLCVHHNDHILARVP